MTAAPVLLLLWMQVQMPASLACAGEGAVDCWLAKGVAHAFAAKAERDADRKRTLLEDAAFDFEQALKLDPNRGAALNNLAQVDADLGRDADAERFFKQAVALNDPLRPFYRRNFGDFLAARGQWDRAIQQYRGTLEEQLSDLQAHESLVALYTRHRPEGFPKYLRFLLDRGQVVWAGEVALARLQDDPAEEYLSFLAEARAGQAIPPDQLLPQDAVDVLRPLTGHPQLGEGARELLVLGEGSDFDSASFSWWAERPGLRQAFRGLARSFGDSQRQAGRVASAGDYYRLAVLLTPEEPDLVSFRRMLDLPAATEDAQAIDRLVSWNERSLRKSRPERDEVYRYRHDLGLHYAALGRWKAGRSPTSGLYQLKKAIELSGAVEPPGGDPPFDARIYIRLAELYIASGSPEMAAQTLRSLAGAYSDQGMGAEAGILNLTVPAETGGETGPDITRSTMDVTSDPLVPLRDFTTEPPRPPSP